MELEAKEYRNNYARVHQYIRTHYKKAGVCGFCNEKKPITEWAKKRESKYTPNIEDYHELCRPCHRKYDITEETRQKMSKSHKGTRKSWQDIPVVISKDGIETEYPSIGTAAEALGVNRRVFDYKNGFYGYKVTRLKRLRHKPL